MVEDNEPSESNGRDGAPDASSEPTGKGRKIVEALKQQRERTKTGHGRLAQTKVPVVRDLARLNLKMIEVEEQMARKARRRFLEPVSPSKAAAVAATATRIALPATPLAKAGIQFKKKGEATQRTVEIVIPADLQEAFARGDIKLMTMKRGSTTSLIVDAPTFQTAGKNLRKGHVAGQAALREPSKAARMRKVAGPAAFNALALIVGEVQMAEINRRLQAIDGKLERLDSNEHAKAEARVRAHAPTVQEADGLLIRGTTVPADLMARLHDAQVDAAKTAIQYVERVNRQYSLLSAAQESTDPEAKRKAWLRYFKDAPCWIRDLQVFLASGQAWLEATALLGAAKTEDALDVWLHSNEQTRAALDNTTRAALECLAAGGLTVDELRFMGFKPTERMNPLSKRSKRRREAVDSLAVLIGGDEEDRFQLILDIGSED